MADVDLCAALDTLGMSDQADVLCKLRPLAMTLCSDERALLSLLKQAGIAKMGLRYKVMQLFQALPSSSTAPSAAAGYSPCGGVSRHTSLREEWTRLTPRIALTRRADMQDGFGAQLHRMLAVYCLCREHGFEYVHTPMVDISNQGIVALEAGSHSAQYVDECNAFASLPCSATIRQLRTEADSGIGWQLIERDLGVEELLALRDSSRHTNVLVRYIDCPPSCALPVSHRASCHLMLCAI